VDSIIPKKSSTNGSLSLTASHKFVSKRLFSGKQKKGKGKGMGSVPHLPPMLSTTMAVTHRFRFSIATDLAVQAITVLTAAGACGGIYGQSTQFYPWASTIRVRKVTLWPSATLSGVGNPTIQWQSAGGGFTKDEAKNEAVPSGITVDTPLVSKPPPNSLVSDWLEVNFSYADTIFSVTAPAGCVMDVDMSFTLGNALQPSSSVVQTVGSNVVGNVYYNYLDGYANGNIKPLGVPVIE
jgi:hypothetical protein